MHNRSSSLRSAITLLALAAIVIAPSTLVAQSRGTVRGGVLDSASGAPVPGASVTIVGTRLGALTDNEGNYSIRTVPTGQQTVRFARLGYAPRTRVVTVPDGGEVVANFRVEHSAVQLEQVVTTVTGAQRTAELGHVVAQLNSDSLAQIAPIRSVSDQLEARVAG